jgi:Cu(I)/Ag(I) efflux system membrane fusion protein
VTIVSPADGVVGELGAREGMNATAGTMLFRINGLGTVWVNLDVPEVMAGLVRPGASLEATVPAYPGEKFRGSVSAVLPDVNAATRTARARVQLDNPGAKLKPGMFAAVRILDSRPAASEVVLVPSEAVIVTGERSVVIVDRGEGRYEPVPVKIGAEEGGRTEVLDGLHGGEKVVASGQFMIDSEASLRGVERRMDRSASPGPAAAVKHTAEGKVERVTADGATISHGPVPSLKWPSMTMEFKAAPAVAGELKAGETIHFEFVKTPAGEYEVTGVHRMGAKP